MTAKSSKGFFSSAFSAIVRARQAQADRHVASVLLSLDDAALRAGGYDRTELRKRAKVSFF